MHNNAQLTHAKFTHVKIFFNFEGRHKHCNSLLTELCLVIVAYHAFSYADDVFTRQEAR